MGNSDLRCGLQVRRVGGGPTNIRVGNDTRRFPWTPLRHAVSTPPAHSRQRRKFSQVRSAQATWTRCGNRNRLGCVHQLSVKSDQPWIGSTCSRMVERGLHQKWRLLLHALFIAASPPPRRSITTTVNNTVFIIKCLFGSRSARGVLSST